MNNRNKSLFLIAIVAIAGGGITAEARTQTTLERGWRFAKIDTLGQQGKWQDVRVPHDWAVHEPFSRDNDLQVVAVEQNGETEKTEKTGRTSLIWGEGYTRPYSMLQIQLGKNSRSCSTER